MKRVEAGRALPCGGKSAHHDELGRSRGTQHIARNVANTRMPIRIFLSQKLELVSWSSIRRPETFRFGSYKPHTGSGSLTISLNNSLPQAVGMRLRCSVYSGLIPQDIAVSNSGCGRATPHPNRRYASRFPTAVALVGKLNSDKLELSDLIAVLPPFSVPCYLRILFIYGKTLEDGGDYA